MLCIPVQDSHDVCRVFSLVVVEYKYLILDIRDVRTLIRLAGLARLGATAVDIEREVVLSSHCVHREGAAVVLEEEEMDVVDIALVRFSIFKFIAISTGACIIRLEGD